MNMPLPPMGTVSQPAEAVDVTVQVAGGFMPGTGTSSSGDSRRSEKPRIELAPPP